VVQDGLTERGHARRRQLVLAHDTRSLIAAWSHTAANRAELGVCNSL
jgi:hypothetical protein